MNSYPVTAILIFVGLLGETHLAADIGLVQGVMLALFYAFSANSRSIILNNEAKVNVNHIFITRTTLILPLGVIAFIASVYMSSIDMMLVIALIIRRSVEWIGELHLSWKESSNDGKFAMRYSFLEGSLLLLIVAWYLAKAPLPGIGMLIWAAVPLIMHVPFIRNMIKTEGSLRSLRPYWDIMLPQLGSTMIIGVSVYIFRLIIVLVSGKSEAGDLFTAFALGGMIGSLFAQILGPSVVLYESRHKKNYFTILMNSFLLLYCVAGVALFIVANLDFDPLRITGKSPVFWSAVGASMVGGVVMVYAQHSRYRLLQSSGEPNLFGPDLYINIIILACVPYFYYIVGLKALTILSLVNAILSYVIYCSTEKEYSEEDLERSGIKNKVVATVLVMFILLPVFYQMQGGIFRQPIMLFDSGGLINILPIPISVLGCFAGIIFIGHFRRANTTLGSIFIIFIMMLISSLVSTYHQDDATKAKLLFLLQFMLPMFALVLGQQYEAIDKKMLWLQKTFLYILCIIVPVQLVSTWLQGYRHLTSYLYAFSIYQHWQYVPVIFTSAFMITLFGLWDVPPYKRSLLVMVPIMAIYVAASNSVMAVFFLIAGITVFLICLYSRDKARNILIFLLILILPLMAVYIYAFRNENSQWNKVKFIKVDENNNGSMHVRVSRSTGDRLNYWKYYVDGTMKDIKTFYMGNAQRPDRNKYPSAHNYYLDFLYNFGFLPLMPLIGLIGATVYKVYLKRKEISSSPGLLGLVLVVFFILLVDNSLKVGLRQPYPGIFSFFLWGILLSKLFNTSSHLSYKPDIVAITD
ncbi:MAG TPA: O-antigen ligase family protein [candidate division Zixibacteria bacterium]|nr:O-antigen ligase family protein [candidate division Zixibacteria bacterium]